MYDKDKDYQAEINKAVANANFSAAAEAEKARNEKIDGEDLNMKKTYNYTDNPAAVIPDSYYGQKSLSTDYMQQGMDAYKQGNYNAFGAFTGMHNEKSKETGISQPVFNPLLYEDKHADARAAARGAIADYGKKGFSYDPESDIQYQTIKKIKENEASSAMRSMAAQLAAQNGGVLPADMAGLVASSGQSIINQADAQIPELYRMAYEKWADGRSDLYNRYGLLNNESEFDRGNWQLGSQNFWNNVDREREDGKWEKSFLRSNYENDRDYNRGVAESDRAYDRSVLESDREYELNKTNSENDYELNKLNYELSKINSDRDYDLNRAQVYGSLAGSFSNSGKYFNPNAGIKYADSVWNKVYGETPDYAAEAIAASGGSAASAGKTKSKAKSKSAAAKAGSTAAQGAEAAASGEPEMIHVDGIGYLTPRQAEAIGTVAYIDENGQTRYRRG